ncbi:MAG: AAA domain-containing protein, partial [Magnetococcus sp. YQC-5]
QMHNKRVLHRSIRPETIYLFGDGDPDQILPWMKLGNYEWSIYLRSLSRSMRQQPGMDCYQTPEALQAWKEDDGSRDGPGTDAFAMGMLLFECLVRTLREDERVLFDADRYDHTKHMAWLQRLFDGDLDEAYFAGDISTDERSIIVRLINPQRSMRESSLGILMSEVNRLALFDSGLKASYEIKPPRGFTTLDPQHEYTVVRFLKEDIPDLEEPLATQQEVRSLLEKELKNGRVYLDRASTPENPILYIQGLRASFIALPFMLAGGVTSLTFAYLMVARSPHGPVGSSIMVLPNGINLFHINHALPPDKIPGSFTSWQPLFDVARTHEDDGLLSDKAQRFLGLLDLTRKLEKEYWANDVVPYCLIEKAFTERLPEGGIQEGLAIRYDRHRDPDATQASRDRLHDLITRCLDRGSPGVTLGLSNDPFHAYTLDQIWAIKELDLTQMGDAVIHLEHSGEGPHPPPRGYLRPQWMDANRTLYQRRLDVLSQLRSDPMLIETFLDLTASRMYGQPAYDGKLTGRLPASDANEPAANTDELEMESIGMEEADSTSVVDFYSKELDESKKEILREALIQRPIYLVQGPPGTGKTTLAAELVLQVLKENPSARILITAQGHAPLNNLMDRVEKELHHLPRMPIRVRLAKPEKMRTFPDHLQNFTPAKQAQIALQQARRVLQERMGDNEDEDLRDLKVRWRRWLENAMQTDISGIMVHATVQAANLVYATTNDGDLHDLAENDFDLVILEEAARTYPLEAMSVLRLAHWWVLIGDHQQLPPFGIDNLKRQVREWGMEFDRIMAEAVNNNIPAEEVSDEALPLPKTLYGFPNATTLVEETKSWLPFFNKLYGDVAAQDEDAAKRGKERSAIHGRRARRLTTQWRMHPDIGTMVSDLFYPSSETQQGLQNPDDPDFERKKRPWFPLGESFNLLQKRMIWIDIPHVDSPECRDEDLRFAVEEEGARGGGYQNAFEARALIGYLAHNLSYLRYDRQRKRSMETVLLTPYRAQIRMLREIFKSWDNPLTKPLNDRIYTVDSFQGRQAELVAISLVRNNDNPGNLLNQVGFVADLNRANVMFSRAEKLLIIVGCSEMFNPDRQDKRCVLQGGSYGAENTAKTLWALYEQIEKNDGVTSALLFVERSKIREMASYRKNREQRREQIYQRGEG